MLLLPVSASQGRGNCQCVSLTKLFFSLLSRFRGDGRQTPSKHIHCSGALAKEDLERVCVVPIYSISSGHGRQVQPKKLTLPHALVKTVDLSYSMLDMYITTVQLAARVTPLLTAFLKW